jgi:hypothetical protein
MGHVGLKSCVNSRTLKQVMRIAILTITRSMLLRLQQLCNGLINFLIIPPVPHAGGSKSLKKQPTQ